MDYLFFIALFLILGVVGYFLMGAVDRFIARCHFPDADRRRPAVPAEPKRKSPPSSTGVSRTGIRRRERLSLRLSKLLQRPTRVLIVGYILVISSGALLLMMPASSRSGAFTPPVEALFTATTATCVTGLVVYDTFSHWSGFGQGVILSLIQIGGIGFMTVMMYIFSFTHHKFGLAERSIMQESISAPKLGGIVRMGRFVLYLTAAIEGVGAALLATRFVPDFGWGRGIYFAVFHSISAYCNAGIDLMGFRSPFSSLTAYAGDPVVSLTISALIICGGLGFVVWEDILQHRHHFSRYRLQAKIVVTATAALLAGGTALFMLFEWGGAGLAGRSLGDRVLVSFFQAVTPRTAGFNTVDLASLSGPTTMLLIALMLTGGAPGSTAGGFKVTTAAVLILCVVSIIRKRDGPACFGRRLEDDTTRKAFTVFACYVALTVAIASLITVLDSVPLRSTLFEAASAIGTVGLSHGITPGLSSASHLLLIFLMYFGKVGCLPFIYTLAERIREKPNHLPVGKVAVG